MDTKAEPLYTHEIRSRFKDLGALEDLDGLLADLVTRPGWQMVTMLLEQLADESSLKSERREPLQHVEYAYEAGRRSGLRAAQQLVLAARGVYAAAAAEQRKRNERAGTVGAGR